MASITTNLFRLQSKVDLPYSKFNKFVRDQMDKYFTKPFSFALQTTQQARNKYYSKWNKDYQIASHYIGDEQWQEIPAVLWNVKKAVKREPIECDNKSVMETLNELMEQGEDLTQYFKRIDEEFSVIDVRKSYTLAQLFNFPDKLQIPIFNTCDNMEKYDGTNIKCGFYFVSNYWVQGKYYKIPYPTGFVPHYVVKVLKEKYGLQDEHIKYQILARETISAGIIRRYVEQLFKYFNKDELKQLVNVYSGTTKKTIYNIIDSFITNDIIFLSAYINMKQSPNVKTMRIPITNEKPNYVVYHQEDRRKNMDRTNIYQYIIGGGQLKVLSLLDECMTEKSELVSIKTDSISVVGEINKTDKIIPLPEGKKAKEWPYNSDDGEGSYEEMDTDSDDEKPQDQNEQEVEKEDIFEQDRDEEKSQDQNEQEVEKEPEMLDIKELKRRPYHMENKWKPLIFQGDEHLENIVNFPEKDNKKFEKWIKPIKQEDYDENKDYSNDSTLTQGDGGSGKSFEISKQFKIQVKKLLDAGLKNIEEYLIVLTFTHSAKESLVITIGKHTEYYETKKYIDNGTPITPVRKKAIKQEKKKWMGYMRKCIKTLDAYFGFEGANEDNENNRPDNTEEDDEWTSQFQDAEQNRIKKLKVSKLRCMLIDEYSMISKEKWFHLEYRIRQHSGRLVIKLFGDINQCPPTEKIKYNPTEGGAQALKNILQMKMYDKNGQEHIKDGYIIKMKYREGANQRCDNVIMRIINKLKETREIDCNDDFIKNMKKNHPKKQRKKYQRSITHTRDKCIELNAKIRPQDALQPNDIVICCKSESYQGYNNKDEKLEKKLWIYNNERMKVLEQVNEDSKIKLKLEKMDETGNYIWANNPVVPRPDKEYNMRLFTLEKSETTYKYQGMTIEQENYIIKEITSMNLQEVITALGRARNHKQIYIQNYKKLQGHKFYSAYDDKKPKKIKIEKMKQMMLFKMYLMTELRDDGEKWYYIGQVESKDAFGNKRTIKNRRNEHIEATKEEWTEKCEIKLIGQYLAFNRKDAERCEAMLVQDYKNMPKYKDWILKNQIYADKTGDNDKFSSNTNQIDFTMDDYINRVMPPVIIEKKVDDKGYNRLQCRLRNSHWKPYKEFLPNKSLNIYISYTPAGEKKRKKWKKEGLIPYLEEAKKEMEETRRQYFKALYPSFYELFTNQNQKESEEISVEIEESEESEEKSNKESEESEESEEKPVEKPRGEIHKYFKIKDKNKKNDKTKKSKKNDKTKKSKKKVKKTFKSLMEMTRNPPQKNNQGCMFDTSSDEDDQ